MAIAGDESAERHARAQALYGRYYANIYRYALSELRSAQDAEDAAQNTFLRAFAAMQKGVVPENEAAWLFKIAHNVCASSKLAWLRRRRVETPRDLDLLPTQPEAIEPPREELDGLGVALANMPPRLREAFLLREWQGLSYAEIAERLDTSRSAVETLIFRARRHLANELQRVQTLWLGPIANWLRGSFGSGGAALLRGAGVVVVAAGVTAAATVPAARDQPARTGPHAVRAGGAPEGALASLSAHPRRHTRSATAPQRQTAPRRPGDAPPADAADVDVAPTGIRTPVAEESVQDARAVGPAPPAAAGAEEHARTATAGATSEQPAQPQATLPAATPPPATVPSAPVPTTTAPALTAPAVTAPAVTAPAVTAPAATVPAATVPVVTVPVVSTPVATTPTVTTPTVPPPPALP